MTTRLLTRFRGHHAGGRRKAADRWRNRHLGDAGFTLTELLIASTLLVVLLTVVMITMSVFSGVSDSVISQYQEYDQALPALAPLQTLLRAEVEPAPYAYPNTDAYGYPATAPTPQPPTPGFGTGTAGSIGNFSLTFYSNIGTAYNNVTSVTTTTTSSPTTTTTIPTTGLDTAGPAMIVAGEYDQSDFPVTPSSSCTASSSCSFQVREYLPTLNSDGTPTCPVGTQPGPGCSYNMSKYTLITDVLNVVNNPYTTVANPTPADPIFSYSMIDPITDVSMGPTTANVESSTQNFTIPPAETTSLADVDLGATADTPGISYNGVAGSTSLDNCTLPTASLPTIALSCPADAINSVGIDLMVGVKGSSTSPNSTSNQVNNETVVYRYPADSGSVYYPYQCEASVQTSNGGTTCGYSLTTG